MRMDIRSHWSKWLIVEQVDNLHNLLAIQRISHIVLTEKKTPPLFPSKIKICAFFMIILG